MPRYQNRYVAQIAEAEFERIERRVKLHDLRVLLAVAQAGTMGRAAERLATSQPAISRSIADLERTLGVRLLDRNARGIEPTPYGKALIKRGLGAFDELRQGLCDIEFLANPTRGEVRLAASIAIAQGFVAAIIERLSRRYPRLIFQVEAGDTRMAYAALEHREVDLAVVHVSKPMIEQPANVEILFREPHVVAVGPKSAWLRRRRIGLTDLINERWALPPPDSPYGVVVAEAFRNDGLDVPRTAVVSTLPIRQKLTATGGFLTMVPRSVVRYAGAAALKSLPIDLPTTNRPLGVLTLKDRTLNPVAQLFLECARKLARGPHR